MTEPTPAPPTRRTRLRQWYDHVFLPLYNTWAPAVLSVCILFSGFAMVSTYLQQRTQAALVDLQRAVGGPAVLSALATAPSESAPGPVPPTTSPNR